MSLALLLQVLLGGWALPCRSESTVVRAPQDQSAHHHDAPPQDERRHDASACLTAPACTVLMVVVAGAGPAESPRAVGRVDTVAGDPRSVVQAPELPPPRG